MLFYKKSNFKIIINNKVIRIDCLMTVIGICKYSGGGMQFTEKIATSSGLLNITIVKNFTFLDLIIHLPKLYSGKIVNHKKVSTYKTNEITIIPKNSKPFIQADGELIGAGNVHVTIIKKAIQFVIR
jgi:diacylglycerol kinase (ATP)